MRIAKEVVETPKFSHMSNSGSIPGETFSQRLLNNLDFCFWVVQQVNSENQYRVIFQVSKAYLHLSAPSMLLKVRKAVVA